MASGRLSYMDIARCIKLEIRHEAGTVQRILFRSCDRLGKYFALLREHYLKICDGTCAVHLKLGRLLQRYHDRYSVRADIRN